MDCERCQPLLIDVACDALDASAAAEVRAHAQGCASCGPALQKLQRGLSFASQLPEAEPSARVSERIMELAREHALAARALATPSTSRVEQSRSFADTVREFLGQFAMGRQFAMATMMVLVTAVGLWLVPRARPHEHEIAGGNVVNPDPDGEAGPSNGIIPAAPLDLDLRQGRIRPRDEAPLERAAREPMPSAEAPEQEAERIAEADEAAKGKELAAAELAEATDRAPDDLLGGLDDEAREEAAMAQAPAAEPSAASSTAERKSRPRAATSAFDERSRGGDGYAVAETEAPAAPSYGRAQAAEPQPTVAAAPAPTTAFAPPPAPRRAASPAGGAANDSLAAESVGSSTASAPTKSDHVADGFASYRAAHYDKAIAAFEIARRDSGDQLSPTARLALARSYQRTARCAQAVAQFEIVLRTATRNRDVMLEAAACYRTLGRADDASQMTARANAVPTATPTNKSAAPATTAAERE